MSQEVVYTLSLKDMLTPKITEANVHVNKFEQSISKAGESAVHMGRHLIGALGASFALFKGWEFLHSGIEALHELHAAEAQVEAGLESTHHAAGITFEELETSARSMAGQFKYSRAQIFDMQSVLLTFPQVTKATFGEAEQAVVDMSTRLKQDLQSTVIQVGKALQDPIHGITALRRVGVNFNETQTEMVKRLVATGQQAKAQAFILNELKTEFGGSAKAAADADPYFKFNKLMGQVKLALAETANTLLKYLVPALVYMIETIKSAVNWMREHKALMTAIGVAAGVAAVGFGIYYVWTNAISWATKAWTGVQWLLNAALEANPIGVVITAIGVMVGLVVYAWNKWAGFRAFLYAVWGTIKEFGRIVSDVFQGIWHVIHGVFTFNPKEITSGFSQAADAMLDSGKRMATAYKSGWDEGMADFNKDAEKKPDLIKEPAKEKKGIAAVPEAPTTKGLSSKNTGTKNIKIDIKINNLIDKFSVNTTNMREGYDKIKEHVTQALLSAVNDSQIVAGE